MSTADLRTWVEISRDALHANVQLLRSALGPETVFCAHVGANAYGHDLEIIVPLLAEAHVRHFAVYDIDEALVVRRLHADAEIIVNDTVPLTRVREAMRAGCTLAAVDETYLRAIAEHATAEQIQGKVVLIIESGMQHLGMPLRQVSDAVRYIAANGRALTLSGMVSPLATSKEIAGQGIVDAQAAVFAEAVKMAATYHLHPPLLQIADSAAVITRPDVHFSMVRCGSAMFGLWPSHELKVAVQRGRAFELRPVLTWKTAIAQVKDIPAGASIGEGYAFTANRPMRIAVLPVGYADGYDRGLAGKGRVLVKGYPCAVLGRIGIRTCAVDISAVPQVKSGEPVTLLGKEGMHTVAAEDLSAILGTIHYETVSRISPLIPRIVV